MSKPLIAFFLGLFSFLLFMFVGGSLTYRRGDAGMILTFVLMAAYFFVCQFLLSRGNPHAYRKDWRIMLALVAVFLVIFVVMAISERREVVLTQGVGILLSCLVGTFAGAVVASLAARRAGTRH
ncbi:MAG: hypothetical protein ABIN58_02495 [candidate division WOR-3 bacterium]